MGAGSGHRTAFRTQIECAPGVSAFRFDKPKGYSFAPGQYFRLTLDTRDGEQTKSFSHSDAPADRFVELTTRMSGSAFKDALASLSRGAEVTMTGPYGRLVVPEGVTKVAFLVGGVGITPARSIIRDADQRDSGLLVTLFYGNRDKDCIPYREELDDIAARRPEIRVVHVISEPDDAWRGEAGFITAGLVRRFIDPDDWTFFVAGPPMMLEPMTDVLDELGVPTQRRHIESFAGYE